MFETYDPEHSLNADFTFNNAEKHATIFGKVYHFKRALKEMSYLDEKSAVSLSFAENYP